MIRDKKLAEALEFAQKNLVEKVDKFIKFVNHYSQKFFNFYIQFQNYFLKNFF